MRNCPKGWLSARSNALLGELAVHVAECNDHSLQRRGLFLLRRPNQTESRGLLLLRRPNHTESRGLFLLYRQNRKESHFVQRRPSRTQNAPHLQYKAKMGSKKLGPHCAWALPAPLVSTKCTARKNPYG